jgi:hypothetical protein
MDALRPTDGFVHASPRATRPVATGAPSTQNVRRRSSNLATTSTPVSGVVSRQQERATES